MVLSPFWRKPRLGLALGSGGLGGAAHIGVLQALGAKRGLLARVFFWQGILLGAVGIVLGLVLGLGLLWLLKGRPIHVPELTFAQQLPVLIKGKDLVLAGGAALMVAGGAGLAAAREAGRQKIVEVLVHE